MTRRTRRGETMKFYDCKTAPSPRRTRMFIAEKGLDIETIQIDLATQEQLGDAFRAINPACTVPALQLDDGTVLAENLAIASYLEDTHPEPPLLGRNAVERAMVLEWNAKTEVAGLSGVADALRNRAKGMKGRALTGPHNFEQIPELAARGVVRVQHFFDLLDERLADNQFLAGDFYSMADITATVVVDFAAWVKQEPTDKQKNLRRWHAEMAARSNYKA